MPASVQVLLVERQQAFAEALNEQLTDHKGFTLTHFTDSEAALAHAKGGSAFDLILLGAGGEGLAAHLRQEGFKGPMIALMDKEQRVPEVNDTLVKPFRFGVLVARMRAHLHSHAQSEEAALTIGPYRFHPATRTLCQDQQPDIRLTDKEASILKYLHRAGDQSVSRETLLDEVWGYNSGVTTHTLETHIYRLRQKIEPTQGEPSLLLTDEGGYRLASEGGER